MLTMDHLRVETSGVWLLKEKKRSSNNAIYIYDTNVNSRLGLGVEWIKCYLLTEKKLKMELCQMCDTYQVFI